MTEFDGKFEVLYKTHYKALRNAAENIIRDKDAAHDVVQEVFVKLWHRRDELGAIINERAYLMRSVVNTAITYLNQNKKKKDIEHLHIEWQGSTDAEMLTRELQGKIDHALENLPPKCKAIFVLSRFENMKNKEIAATLGLSLKTVENQMGIALKKLKDDLKMYLKGDFFILLAMGLYTLILEGFC